MFVSQTRMLLLQTGRVSMELWVRAGHMAEPGLASDARVVYDRMANQVPWPDQQANRALLVYTVLPAAALYAALLERGWARQDAVDAVQAALKTMAEPSRKVMALLLRTEQGRKLSLRSVEPLTGWMFPAPASQVTWVERSENRVAFDVTRCYAVDTLCRLDAAPVAVALCATDEYIMSVCPRLRWSRTGTLAAGADRCDFCVELLSTGTSRETA